MEDYSIHLKTICCTCLCVDRKLSKLCRIPNGVNNLYYLLSYDTEAFREVFFKGSANLHICWECSNLMRRLCEFREKVCIAQKQLSQIVEGCIELNILKCLSKLSIYHQSTYNNVFIFDDGQDNFVDCGPDIKEESDTDDVPLSELHNTNETISVLHNVELEYKFDITHLTSQQKRKKKVSDATEYASKNIDHKHFSTTEISEVEMLNNMEKRKADDYVKASWKCEICIDSFKNDTELEKHNMMFHSKVRKKSARVRNPGTKPRRNTAMMDKRTPFGYSCTECDKHFENKNKRYKHIQTFHREGFKCATCGKKFAFKNNLTRHEQLHAGPPPREQCPVCGKMVRTDLFRTHARTHDARETFACVACDKRFVSRASYEHHLKYTRPHATHDILKFKCTACGKGYRSRGELRDHVNYQHMGRTSHKCPVCDKALATRRCITRHVKRAHYGIKESARDKICQTCGKTFRDKKGLREHESIHTGERPLICTECGRTFRQSASLYTHRRRVHNLAPPAREPPLLIHNDTDKL